MQDKNVEKIGWKSGRQQEEAAVVVGAEITLYRHRDECDVGSIQWRSGSWVSRCSMYVESEGQGVSKEEGAESREY